VSGDEQRERPPRAKAGDGRDGDGHGPFSYESIAPRPAHVNAFYDRFALDPDIDFPIAGRDPLAAVFMADLEDLLAMAQHSREPAPIARPADRPRTRPVARGIEL
jgi:hypothetical protein